MSTTPTQVTGKTAGEANAVLSKVQTTPNCAVVACTLAPARVHSRGYVGRKAAEAGADTYPSLLAGPRVALRRYVSYRTASAMEPCAPLPSESPQRPGAH